MIGALSIYEAKIILRSVNVREDQVKVRSFIVLNSPKAWHKTQRHNPRLNSWIKRVNLMPWVGI